MYSWHPRSLGALFFFFSRWAGHIQNTCYDVNTTQQSFFIFFKKKSSTYNYKEKEHTVPFTHTNCTSVALFG